MRWIAIFVLLIAASPAMACGVKSDCKLGDRVYRVYVPGGGKIKSRGAIVFAHGWRNSAAGTMSNKSLLKLADELDAVLVAPQSIQDDWQVPNRPQDRFNTGEIEFVYFDALVKEIRKRYGVDGNRILMTGFSAGGMMTWNLACQRSKLFAGFAPIAGTFWAPVPEKCPGGPVNMMHFHGRKDGMVPLGGREIADARQGEVYQALALFAKIGKFGKPRAVPAKDLECERSKNPGGKILEFCTHGGGHVYKAEFIRRAWKAFGLDRKS